MIELVSGNTRNTYINKGEMLSSKFINDKFNYYSEVKIDFHRTNTAKNIYVNLGKYVEPDKINEIVNKDLLITEKVIS